MKFEEAKVGMKVSAKGMTGTIVEVDKRDKSVLISFSNDTSLWFWDIDHSSFPLKDIEVMSTDVKVPKFDTCLYDSAEFTGYLNALKDKYNKLLNANTYIVEVSISANGTIKVKDNHGNKSKAKCHKDDAFNLETGMKLAVQRLSEKCPFIPKRGEEYWKVFSTEGNIVSILYYKGFFVQELDIAIGNCFRTEEEAKKHKFEIIDKFRTLLDLTNIMTVGDKV